MQSFVCPLQTLLIGSLAYGYMSYGMPGYFHQKMLALQVTLGNVSYYVQISIITGHCCLNTVQLNSLPVHFPPRDPYPSHFCMLHI